ncbi:unnamed protein product [Diplocarpon coronariae]
MPMKSIPEILVPRVRGLLLGHSLSSNRAGRKDSHGGDEGFVGGGALGQIPQPSVSGTASRQAATEAAHTEMADKPLQSNRGEGVDSAAATKTNRHGMLRPAGSTTVRPRRKRDLEMKMTASAPSRERADDGLVPAAPRSIPRPQIAREEPPSLTAADAADGIRGAHLAGAAFSLARPRRSARRAGVRGQGSLPRPDTLVRCHVVSACRRGGEVLLHARLDGRAAGRGRDGWRCATPKTSDPDRDPEEEVKSARARAPGATACTAESMQDESRTGARPSSRACGVRDLGVDDGGKPGPSTLSPPRRRGTETDTARGGRMNLPAREGDDSSLGLATAEEKNLPRLGGERLS